MHEASLMVGLMRQIEAIARRAGARRVVGVSVWLGALSHFSEAHFTAHFEAAAAGTIAEGATLDVTLSIDTAHENALEVVLESIDVEE